jgi:hypothetical protein
MCRNGTGDEPDLRSVNVGLQYNSISDELRHARNAETAHLEAVMKVDGVKALRLALLADHVRQSIPDSALELRTVAGEEPHLWIDLAHRVTMEPDPKTFRLSFHGVDRIDTLLETEDITRMLAAIRSVLAHGQVNAARGAPDRLTMPTAWSYMTLFYVWMTGIVTGVAAVTLLVMILKKLPF